MYIYCIRLQINKHKLFISLSEVSLSRPRHVDDAQVDRWPIVFVKLKINLPRLLPVDIKRHLNLLNICVVKEPLSLNVFV